MKNKDMFFIPVKAALYAAMFKNTWNANSATSNQLIHFSDRLNVATFFGPVLFANFDFLSASFASLIIPGQASKSLMRWPIPK